MMGDTSAARITRAIAPSLVLAIVVFMVLTQLRIAPAIVIATYIALIGMLAVSGALAFGLEGARSPQTCCGTRTTRRDDKRPNRREAPSASDRVGL